MTHKVSNHESELCIVFLRSVLIILVFISTLDHSNLSTSEIYNPVYAIKVQLHDIDLPSDRGFRAIPLELKNDLGKNPNLKIQKEVICSPIEEGQESL